MDELLMRVNDAVTAFPSILLALVFISLLGFGTYNVILALGIAFIPSYARVIRGVRPRGDELCEKRPAHGGQPPADHAGTHPAQHPAGARATLAIGFNNAVLAEASMSFLGIGVKPPEVSLGYMMSESQSYMVRAPWYMLTCGSVIVLADLRGQPHRRGPAAEEMGEVAPCWRSRTFMCSSIPPTTRRYGAST
ncbi:MAG: ABC transporter permease [Oscillospiraceae bacterium]